HPVDFYTATCDAIGEPYDATVALATREAMGEIHCLLAFWEPETAAAARKRVCGLPFGLVGRPSDDGETEIINIRRLASESSVETYNLNDLTDRSVVWTLSESSQVTRLVWNQQRFVLYTGPADDEDRPLSGLVMQEQTYLYPEPMPDGEAVVELAVDLPGELVRADLSGDEGNAEFPALDYV